MKLACKIDCLFIFIICLSDEIFCQYMKCLPYISLECGTIAEKISSVLVIDIFRIQVQTIHIKEIIIHLAHCFHKLLHEFLHPRKIPFLTFSHRSHRCLSAHLILVPAFPVHSLSLYIQQAVKMVLCQHPHLVIFFIDLIKLQNHPCMMQIPFIFRLHCSAPSNFFFPAFSLRICFSGSVMTALPDA